MIETYKNSSKEELITELIEQNFTITQLKEQLAQIKKLVYGSKSERFVPPVNPEQIIIDFDLPSDKLEQVGRLQNIAYMRRQAKKNKTVSTGRMSIPAHLPRVEIIIEPKEDVTGWVKIGEEITEELELKPAEFFVNKYVRSKYAKANGERIAIGELPSRPIDKGIPGPNFLATIITDKYLDHLPLYRQLKRYERMGIKLNDSTFSDWVQQTARLIEPLYDELKRQVLNEHYLQADETPIKVLDPDKKQGTTHRGYYWVYHSPQKRLVLFDYQQGRDRGGPSEILKDFNGFLQTDGYGVYDDFDKKDNITQLNCWAHARRMFDEAKDNDKQRAEFALIKIQQLYELERKAKEEFFTHEQRCVLRQEQALAVLNELEQWLKVNIIQVTPKSLIGKAIAYTLVRWEKLYRYTQYGELEIDNNLVENAIRPVALGRKNYLFAGSHQAAQRAGMIYSLLASCKHNGIEPNGWLKNILKVLPDHKANQLHLLLPQAQNVVQN
ncbi:MAG: IS66 family transposase [Bacteroidetes bacterium]|nr:IS66 family transposase [Bacteroidota bacterium]